jgi:hypothetical protein
LSSGEFFETIFRHWLAESGGPAGDEATPGEFVDAPGGLEKSVPVDRSVELTDINGDLIFEFVLAIPGIGLDVTGALASPEIAGKDASEIVAEVAAPFVKVGYFHLMRAGLEYEIRTFDKVVGHVDGTNADTDIPSGRRAADRRENVVVSLSGTGGQSEERDQEIKTGSHGLLAAGAGDLFTVRVFPEKKRVGFVRNLGGHALDGADGGAEFVHGASKVSVYGSVVGKRLEGLVDLGESVAKVAGERFGIIGDEDGVERFDSFRDVVECVLCVSHDPLAGHHGEVHVTESFGRFIGCLTNFGDEFIKLEVIEFIKESSNLILEVFKTGMDGGKNDELSPFLDAGVNGIRIVIQVNIELSSEEITRLE